MHVYSYIAQEGAAEGNQGAVYTETRGSRVPKNFHYSMLCP